MSGSARGSFLFISGTDTGVGKTFVTAGLIHCLRSRGISACAIKPVSCGDRSDGALLHSLQRDSLSLDEVNPFHFEFAAAPSVAARKAGRRLVLDAVMRRLQRAAESFELVLVEGVGGVLSPLGREITNLTLMRELDSPVLLVIPDRLGAISQGGAALMALRTGGIREISFLMNPGVCENGAARGLANLKSLAGLFPEVRGIQLEGAVANSLASVSYEGGVKNGEKALERRGGFDNFLALFNRLNLRLGNGGERDKK